MSRNVLYLIGSVCLLLTVAGVILWAAVGIEDLNAQSDNAQQGVVKIVNQPITHLARSGPVSLFAPGWFHDGAVKPDFDNVDIRATQELSYEGHVTSDLNPTEMFVGSELEFNMMTKYFYTDRSLPKKRLSNAEMIEINSLYRVIGRDEQAVGMRWLAIAAMAVAACAIGSAMFLLNVRARSQAV